VLTHVVVMRKVLEFALWSGEIRIKSEKPQEKTDVGEMVALGFGFRAYVCGLPEVQQKMQCVIGTAIESL